MNRLYAKLVVTFAFVAFAVSGTAAGILAAQPDDTRQPSGCIWRYFGPASGWGLVADGCRGDCDEPAVQNPYLGQQESTPCSDASGGRSR